MCVITWHRNWQEKDLPMQVPTGCPHKFTNQIHRRRGEDIQTQTTWRYLKINLIKNKDHIQITFRSFSACPCHFPNTAAMPNMPSCHSTSISWQYQALPKSEWTADNSDNCKKVWIESQFIQRFGDRSVNLLLNCEVYVAFLVKYDFLVWIDLIHPWLWRFKWEHDQPIRDSTRPDFAWKSCSHPASKQLRWRWKECRLRKWHP